MAKRLLLPILAIAGVTFGACGVHQTDNPTSLTGPSTVAISTQINAIPDRISQDGSGRRAGRF